MSPLLPVAWGLPSGGWAMSAAQVVVEQGPDLTGIAALVAAVGGVISAVGGLLIGLRTKRADVEDVRAEVLMQMLIKALEDDDDQAVR